jgi:predicted HTH transcriptional regulator
MQITSIEAYQSVKQHIPSIQERIVNHISKFGPDTCDHMEYILVLSHQTCSASIRGLVKQGILEDSGDKNYTRSGRRAIMWKLTENTNEELTEAK